jgi:hypothetical protein
MEIMQQLLVNVLFFGLAILLAKVFTTYMRNNYPFIELSDIHYFVAMMIWCTIISVLDIILPYGHTAYSISMLLHDIFMATLLTVFNRYWQDKNF